MSVKSFSSVGGGGFIFIYNNSTFMFTAGPLVPQRSVPFFSNDYFPYHSPNHYAGGDKTVLKVVGLHRVPITLQ